MGLHQMVTIRARIVKQNDDTRSAQVLLNSGQWLTVSYDDIAEEVEALPIPEDDAPLVETPAEVVPSVTPVTPAVTVPATPAAV